MKDINNKNKSTSSSNLQKILQNTYKKIESSKNNKSNSFSFSNSSIVSEEYFSSLRRDRNGIELFNIQGDKLQLLSDIIKKNIKKINDREESKYAPVYQVRRVNELLEKRKIEMVRKRLRNLPITNASKYAISGDELNLREEIIKGYPINFRDGTVAIISLFTFNLILCLFVCLIV